MKKIILIFLITIFTNYSFAKDLSGNAVECFGKYDKAIFDSEVTILFINKNKAKFAYTGYYTGYSEAGEEVAEFDLLIPGEEVNYKVLEKKIILKINKIKGFYDPHKFWQRFKENGFLSPAGQIKGEIWIWRETLKIQGFEIINATSCSLVDANNPNLFDKYYEFQKTLNKKLKNYKKDSESKNIL